METNQMFQVKTVRYYFPRGHIWPPPWYKTMPTQTHTPESVLADHHANEILLEARVQLSEVW